MAKCLQAALPTAQQTDMGKLLDTMAWRIARNREIAGLHYPSDTDAGTRLALQVFSKLSTIPLFADETLKNAKDEWK